MAFEKWLNIFKECTYLWCINEMSALPVCSASIMWTSPVTVLSDKDAAFLECGTDKN